ncbi:hypothetical protein HJG60_009615 [Phyllostomus discolor]|uniref:Uncharacterized protein n=1 Tax=Phyllostomus discolor TaxID=89673 RepID=A0A834DC46_9CHIR|nr:hypothetical protein HJG60_009615 [Phyllostomus discolor]
MHSLEDASRPASRSYGDDAAAFDGSAHRTSVLRRERLPFCSRVAVHPGSLRCCCVRVRACGANVRTLIGKRGPGHSEVPPRVSERHFLPARILSASSPRATPDFVHVSLSGHVSVSYASPSLEVQREFCAFCASLGVVPKTPDILPGHRGDSRKPAGAPACRSPDSWGGPQAGPGV